LGDVVSAAKRHVAGGPGLADSIHANLDVVDMSRVKTRYVIQLEVKDQPGVLAKIASLFSEHGVSIETVEQAVLGRNIATASLEIGTHLASDAALAGVVAALKSSSAVESVSSVIRVEGL
jgi:homoserine dehydrogenase